MILLFCPPRAKQTNSLLLIAFGVLSGRLRQIMDTGSAHNLLGQVVLVPRGRLEGLPGHRKCFSRYPKGQWMDARWGGKGHSHNTRKTFSFATTPRAVSDEVSTE